MKFKYLLFVIVGIVQITSAQNKDEQESRIDKADFPNSAYLLIEGYLKDAKRVRFYQETDSTKKSYEAKFKKGRLRYSVEFDEQGTLEDVEFKIKVRDIPNDTWGAIQSYLDKNHYKHRVKKIQQQ